MRQQHIAAFAAALLGLTVAACGPPLDPVDGADSLIQDLRRSWELEAFRGAEGNLIDLAEDELYTIALQDSNRFQARVDCNSCIGRYVAADGGAIAFENEMVCTEVFCGTESHDRAFKDALRVADEFEIEGERLRLAFGDEGVLEFRAATTSP